MPAVASARGMKIVRLIVCLALVGSLFAAEGRAEEKTSPFLYSVDPPRATKDVPSLVIRGGGWGPYDARADVRVWLVNPHKTDEQTEILVDRNYRNDDLFIRAELSEEAKSLLPGGYLIYVLTGNNLHAVAPFELIASSDLRPAKNPTASLTPSRGPVGSYVVITAGGFSKRSSVIIRFDGVKIGGSPMTDDQGFFTDVGLVIPTEIEKDHKKRTVTPGKHIIELSDGNHIVKTEFTVDSSDKEELDRSEREQKKQKEDERERKEAVEREQKERLKKEAERDQLKKKEEQARKELLRVEQERLRLKKLKGDEELGKRERDRIEKELSRIQKKEDAIEKNIDAIENRKEKIEAKIEMIIDRCLEHAPAYAQRACATRSRVLVPDTFGKPCSSEKPITFQPGCVSVLRMVERVFHQKPCTDLLPLVWQDGCILSEKKEALSVSFGKPCDSEKPITFQPGCVSSEPKSTIRQYEGKKCDPSLPRVWQEGCLSPKPSDQPVSPKTSTCNPLIPNYSQKNCLK